MNSARPMTNLFKSAHSTIKWPIHKNTAFKNSNFNHRVNTVKDKKFNTARPKAIVNAVKGNNVNAIKASACWVWKPKTKIQVSDGNPQMDLQDKGVIDSGCSSYMTGNMSYLTDYKEIDGGYVAFGGNPKGGKITGKCTIKTDDYSRFTWVFLLATNDETSGILKSFITGIENLVGHKVKVIRCDNGTEFKNREINEFCEMNAEAVNTACYVQNRVLVVKPHNKTPYALFHGRTPTLTFMRPFGCPITILNTDPSASGVMKWKRGFDKGRIQEKDSVKDGGMISLSWWSERRYGSCAYSCDEVDAMEKVWPRGEEDALGKLTIAHHGNKSLCSKMKKGKKWMYICYRSMIVSDKYLKSSRPDIMYVSIMPESDTKSIQRFSHLHELTTVLKVEWGCRGVASRLTTGGRCEEDGVVNAGRTELYWGLAGVGLVPDNGKLPYSNYLQCLSTKERTAMSSGPTDNVVDEAVNEETGDSLEKAATTATSFDAEQDRGGGPRRQETIGDTIAQTRFENISKTSNDPLLARANEIASLKRRVKKLKRRNRSRTHGLKRMYRVGSSKRVESSKNKGLGEEDASKQERIADIDSNKDIYFVNVHTDEDMFGVNDLDGD
ncbi:retrovirus-related pol polyprotein from transposon TNT 1-94 [Tanacetum coccineum]